MPDLEREGIPSDRRPAGRPRDPRIDGIVLQAAVEVYAEIGWAGFYFDSVARRARVGKTAIYRRWDTREDLLLAAVNPIDIGPIMKDQESIRDALTCLTRYTLGWWFGATGRAYLRMQMDQGAFPFLRELYQDRVIMPLLESVSEVVVRAVAAGELPWGASPVLLIEALCGATMNRMNASGERAQQNLVNDPHGYVSTLVEFLVGGAIAAATSG